MKKIFRKVIYIFVFNKRFNRYSRREAKLIKFAPDPVTLFVEKEGFKGVTELLKGEAMYICLSLNTNPGVVRWELFRVTKTIYKQGSYHSLYFSC